MFLLDPQTGILHLPFFHFEQQMALISSQNLRFTKYYLGYLAVFK